jgi:hypothetical protein
MSPAEDQGMFQYRASALSYNPLITVISVISENQSA